LKYSQFDSRLLQKEAKKIHGKLSAKIFLLFFIWKSLNLGKFHIFKKNLPFFFVKIIISYFFSFSGKKRELLLFFCSSQISKNLIKKEIHMIL